MLIFGDFELAVTFIQELYACIFPKTVWSHIGQMFGQFLTSIELPSIQLLGVGLAGNVKRKDVDVEEVSGKLLEVVNGGHAFVKSREAKGFIVQGRNDMFSV